SEIFKFDFHAAVRHLSLARLFKALSLVKLLRENRLHLLSRRSRRQNKAWGKGEAGTSGQKDLYSSSPRSGRQTLISSARSAARIRGLGGFSPMFPGLRRCRAPPWALCWRPRPRAENRITNTLSRRIGAYANSSDPINTPRDTGSSQSLLMKQ